MDDHHPAPLGGLTYAVKIQFAVGLLVTALLLAACGDSSSNDNSATSAEQPAATATPDDAREQELEDRIAELEAKADEKARKAREKAREEARERKRRQQERREREAREAEPEPDPEQTSGGGITVPDVTGLDHQAAQDALQGEGLWILDEKDCTGQDRLLLFDRNWEVVSTDPPAGSQVDETTTITICSKKQGE